MKKLLSVILLFSLVIANAQKIDTIFASKDNSIFSENANGAAGASTELFAGQIGGLGSNALRRALIKFELAGLVIDTANIDSVKVYFFSTKNSSSTDRTHTLHKLTKDWGEGTSVNSQGKPGTASTGEATWDFAKSTSTAWSTKGGDFVSDASGSATVSTVSSVLFSSNNKMLEKDVISWIKSPNSNNGWIMKGDEQNSKSIKWFASRTNQTESRRPRLLIYSTLTLSTNDALLVSNDFAFNIYDVIGNLKAQGDNYNYSETFSNLPSGMYIVKKEYSNGKVDTRKVIKR